MLNLAEVATVIGSTSSDIDILAPQSYKLVSELSDDVGCFFNFDPDADDEPTHGYLYDLGNGEAVTGSGADSWIKAAPLLDYMRTLPLPPVPPSPAASQSSAEADADEALPAAAKRHKGDAAPC